MIQPRPVEYPESDGQPMAETEAHADCMGDLIQTCRRWLHDPEHWHVHGNQLFYYVEGDPRRCFAPDVYLIPGVPQLPRRRIWKLWEEPHAVPRLVFELTSPSSIDVDLGWKMELYASLGVEEYVVFDVLRSIAGEPVRVFRLHDGAFVEADDGRSLVLGVGLRPEGWRLRLVTPDGSVVLSPAERADMEAERADMEAERARDLEDQLERARAELARLREQADD